MTDKKLFPLEKILTVSARDYCEHRDTVLSYYKMIGVHADGENIKEISEEFNQQAPNAEVIVDYRFRTPDSIAIIASGTALIPKGHGTGTGGQ